MIGRGAAAQRVETDGSSPFEGRARKSALADLRIKNVDLE